MPNIDGPLDVTGAVTTNGPLTANNAGFFALAAEADSGVVTGTRRRREGRISPSGRLSTGVDTVLFSLFLGSTNAPTDVVQQNAATMTATYPGGGVLLNAGSSVTTAQAIQLRTYRTFMTNNASPTRFIYTAREVNPLATNAISEWGPQNITTSSTVQAIDGVYFRRNSSGGLEAVVTVASNDVVTAAINPASVTGRDESGSFDSTEYNTYDISVDQDICVFRINDVVVARIVMPAGVGAAMLVGAMPLSARVLNNGAASAARQLQISSVSVVQQDVATGKPAGHLAAANGGHALAVPAGAGAAGSTVSRAAATAGWPTNAANRLAGTWTNNTAPAINSLGGQWVSPAVSGMTVEADYPVFAYQVPATNAANLPGKTFYCTGVRWGKTVAATAAATALVVFQYGITVGSTGSALSTTDAATTVAAKGMILDMIPFKATAVAGDYVEGGNMDFSAAPLIAPPGTFITFMVRPFPAVATNTLTVYGSVAFAGYFE